MKKIELHDEFNLSQNAKFHQKTSPKSPNGKFDDESIRQLLRSQTGRKNSLPQANSNPMSNNLSQITNGDIQHQKYVEKSHDHYSKNGATLNTLVNTLGFNTHQKFLLKNESTPYLDKIILEDLSSKIERRKKNLRFIPNKYKGKHGFAKLVYHRKKWRDNIGKLFRDRGGLLEE